MKQHFCSFNMRVNLTVVYPLFLFIFYYIRKEHSTNQNGTILFSVPIYD